MEARRLTNKDYTLRQLLEIEACTNCRLCVDVCPAVSASRDGRLSGAYRLDQLRRLTRRRTGLLSRLFHRRVPSVAQLAEFSKTVFSCTLCSNCQEVCPVGLSLKGLWCSIRQDLVRQNVGPDEIDMIRHNLVESHNVFGEENQERMDWVEDLPDAPDDRFVRDSAEVVYFTGCVAAFFPMAQQIPMAMAQILEQQGIDFTLLGQDEWCCGFPLLGAGLKEHFRANIDHNVEVVRRTGARKVVFACPSCYQTWREFYPKDFEIAHAAEFFEALPRGRRMLTEPVPLTVCYHDPCDLGRGARVFEAPRRLIREIPGVKLVELPRNRENCRCCGGGGNLEMTNPTLSAQITEEKVAEVITTGAQAVVTCCQQCVRTMTGYVKKNQIPVEVLDITQLLHRALAIEDTS